MSRDIGRQLREAIALATLDGDAAILDACQVWADWLAEQGDARGLWIARGVALSRMEGGAVEYRSGYSASCGQGAEVVLCAPPPVWIPERPQTFVDTPCAGVTTERDGMGILTITVEIGP